MQASPTNSPQLRVIVSTDPEAGYVVQCVDYDIAAYGPTLDEAIEAFKQRYIGTFAVARQLGIEPLSDVSEVPTEVRDEWHTSFFRRDAVKRFTIPGFRIGSKGEQAYTVPPTAVEAAIPPAVDVAARAAMG